MKLLSPFTPSTLVEGDVGASLFDHDSADNVVSLEKRRTSVDLSETSQQELDWLCTATGGGRADVIRMSLYLFWLLAGMENRNLAIVIRDDDGKNVLFVPTLAAINGLLRGSTADKRLRLTLELPAKALRELEELRKYTGENKKADVIRQAIHLNWALFNEVQKGRKVVVREPTGEEYDLFVPEAGNIQAPESIVQMTSYGQ